MKISSSVIILLSLIFDLNLSIAGTPVLDERQHEQKYRITKGAKSGELTVPETARLIRGQKQLRRMERRAKSDGVITAKERANLHYKANKESAKIAHNKHDRQKRAKAKQ